jgi:hypothetical protein
MANRKKLYYTFGPTALGAAGTPVALLNKSLTQGFASVLYPAPGGTLDDYGNLIDDDPSTTDNLSKTLEAIGGWAETMMDAAAAVRLTTFSVQFYDAATAVVPPGYGVASIDPASVKHPAVQVWGFPALGQPGGNVTGRLLIQRQHSIEV